MFFSTTLDVKAEDGESSERKDACDCCGGKVFCMRCGEEGSRCDRHIPVNEGIHSRRARHRRRLGGAGTGSAFVTRLTGRVYGPLLSLVAVEAAIATAADVTAGGAVSHVVADTHESAATLDGTLRRAR